jgi:hypothetical protein
LGFQAGRADRQNVIPARQGWGIDSPTLSERHRRDTLKLNLHQYSVEKHFQDEPAELQIPIRLRSGQALGFAPNDKGEGGASISPLRLIDRSAVERLLFSTYPELTSRASVRLVSH